MAPTPPPSRSGSGSSLPSSATGPRPTRSGAAKPERRLGLLGGLLLLAVGLLSGAQPGLWRLAERGVDDQLMRLRGPRRPPRQLLLVEIDDASLQQGSWFAEQSKVPSWAHGIGTLPWPRARYGDLIDRLLDAGAAAVAVDVVFAGPSSQGQADDRALTGQLGRWSGRLALATEMLEPEDQAVGSGLTLVQPDGVIAGLSRPPLLGLSNTVPAAPGQPAHHPEHYGQRILPAHGAEPMPSLGNRLLQAAGLRSRQNDPERWLNLYGPAGRFRHVSAWQVLDPSRWALLRRQLDLRAALVLVGPTVADGGGGFDTPFGRLSGLELMATAVANSLDGSGLRPWPLSPWGRALVAALPGLLVLLLARWRRGLAARLGSAAAVLALTLLAAVVAFGQAAVLVPVLGAVAAVIGLGVLFAGDAYLGELAERRRLRRTFERYVAPSLVREILADPDSAQGLLRGEQRPVTVLFSDLKGFTQLTTRRTEQGQIPLHLQQLNTYLGAMVEVISAHGGTVDKFIGDCVMAVFGSPLSRGPQAEAIAAVRCGQAMAARLQQLNASWAAEGLDPLASGIGLASGEVVVGQIGSPQRLDFTVIGHTVNLAARLESLTRQVQAPLLVDQATAELVAGTFALASVGVHPIKGIGAVEAFRLEAG